MSFALGRNHALAWKISPARVKLEAMKKPFIRVTKWLGDIPVEAECTACRGKTNFRAASTTHRPSRDEYQKSLQSQFDAHVKTTHAELPDVTSPR